MEALLAMAARKVPDNDENVSSVARRPGAGDSVSSEESGDNSTDGDDENVPMQPAEPTNVENGKAGAQSSKTPQKAKAKVSPHQDDSDDDESNDKSTPKNGNSKENNNSAKSSDKKKTPKSPGSGKGTPGSSKGTSKSYLQLVHEAIDALKNRNGSSQPAITKYLLTNYPNLQSNSPHNRFKQLMLAALKSGVKAGRFVKVKASWKINSEWKKKQSEAKRRKKRAEQKKKKDNEAKRKKEKAIQQQVEKEKKEKEKERTLEDKIAELRETDPDSEELAKLEAQKAKQDADRKRKEEAEARRKHIADRLRKRRFPMEDTKLHAEDKELGVKPPKDVSPRPPLPNLFALTQTEERRSNKQYAAAASRCENLENGSRGLVPDLLQVYHFFRGDVHYTGSSENAGDRDIVPPFSLRQLIHAVDDVLSGTAKKARMVPPLLVHLFVISLQILTAPPVDDDESPQRRQLQQDFATHLAAALSPASWSDVCFMYMDAMQRHMTTEVSCEKNVLPGLPIDAGYLLHMKDEASRLPDSSVLEGYHGYFGDPDSALAKAHAKLERCDPWLLTAEELMALLRALTDDILARKPEIGEDISNREEQMHELLKAKRAADAKFRKSRLAYEGPKKPTKKPASTNSEDANKKDGKAGKASEKEKSDNCKTDNASEDGANRKSLEDESGDGTKEADAKEEVWKPTITKKQFESAQRAQQKASDAYEKGVRRLMARTEPVGYDRHFNAVYCFRHDPEVLYVELVKPPAASDLPIPEDMQMKRSSWHVIESKSLFDQYGLCLDIRGKRENALYDELMGPQGAQQSLRRFLHDDIKEKAAASAKLKDMEDLKRRLDNARLKCDEEEGRRSGRLASKAEDELIQIESEMTELEQKIKTGKVPKVSDYEELTGLELLRQFDSTGKMETRKTREKKAIATENNFAALNCSKLYSTGNIDGTGIMGLMVSKMLQVEELCESLAPWEHKSVTRKDWIVDLENLIFAWNSSSPPLIGPAESAGPAESPSSRLSIGSVDSALPNGNNKRPSTGGSNPSAKRQKSDDESAASLTVSQAVAKVRQPLLDLEHRVFELTGLATAAKDSDMADDNMSGGADDNDEAEIQAQAWKKLINKLKHLPSKRHVQIRDIVVEAIAAARKSQLKAVVAQLRAALLEFHPQAAGACKTSALAVLESNGGYNDEDDEDDMDEENTEDPQETQELEEIPSALSADAVIANGSLDGIEDASHVDWVGAVKSAKTISRMATLVSAFVKRATRKLEKTQEEHASLLESIAIWEKEEERRARGQGKYGSKKSKADGISEVWANARFTDEMVMAKVEQYPWWPAKKCVAKEEALETSLQSVGRCLVSLVGESGGIRVVKTSEVQPFTGKAPEESGDDAVEMTKDMKVQLDDCMAMARRIIRGRQNRRKS